MSEKKSVQLFDEGAAQLVIQQQDAAAVARAVQEIQAALAIAQRFPRNEVALKLKIIEACKRFELAEVAEYEYSRGGTRITGPTIDLLRAVANRWGNVRYGWTETERYPGISSVRAFAWDMQTNTQAERTFRVPHKRDTREGSYELKDERDIYEALANAAARRVRAALEEVIDADVVQAAVDQCRLTLKSGAGKGPIQDRAMKMVIEFKVFDVTQEMIETMLGNKLDAVSENQMARLRRIYKSLKDGVGTREDFFKLATSAPDFEPPKGSGTAADAKAKLQGSVESTGLQAPETTPPTSQPEPEKPSAGFNPLKAIRTLLNAGGFKEGELLQYWAATGATDGSHTSLEEVHMSVPEIVKFTAENPFGPIAEKLKEMRGGK